MPARFGSKSSPGYPKKFKFASQTELDAYFNGDHIVCLVCGKKLRSMCTQLKVKHNLTPDDYRAEFGIPWRRKLSCSETSALRRSATISRIESGELVLINASDPIQRARIAAAPKRDKQPVSINASTERINEFTKNNPRPNRWETIERDKVYRIRPLSSRIKRRARQKAIARTKGVAEFGSPEYREKMLARPQLKVFGEKMAHYWNGKKQSPEHIRKRFKRTKNQEATE
jgi:hypothetical protein